MKRLANLVLRRKPKEAVALPPPRVLVFDFDGTLADSFQIGQEIFNKLAGEFGYRSLNEAEILEARSMSVRQVMKFTGVSARKLPAIARRGKEELRKKLDSIHPCEGVPDALRALKHHGIILGIVTSNTEENVSRFLANHDLEVFGFIRSSSKLMGKAHDIRRVMRVHGFKREEVLYIGDEIRDIEAAKKAGIRIAAVTWGFCTPQALRDCLPDHMIATPHELLPLCGLPHP